MPIPNHMVTCPICHRTGLYLDLVIEESVSIDAGDSEVWHDTDPTQYLVSARCQNDDCENECGPAQLSDLAHILGYALAKRPDMDRLAQEMEAELAYWLE